VALLALAPVVVTLTREQLAEVLRGKEPPR